MEPAVRTTVSVANIHPLVPPSLETSGNNEFQSSSLEAPPRVRISNRNGVKCGNLMGGCQTVPAVLASKKHN